MKNRILSAVAALFLTATPTLADYTFVVPQEPGGGTSVWAQIVATELEKFLDGERIKVRHIPGNRGVAGFDKWHNELQHNEKTIMVSNGGNALKYLLDQIDYDYREYDSVGMMNLDIITGKKIGASEHDIKLAADSARLPEVMAMMMLVCGPDADYVACFKERVTWIIGMDQNEGRLSYKRDELNVTRENPAAFIKHVANDKTSKVWFTHGLLQADGSHADDPNYPNMQFEILYKERWGVEPTGDFYNGYKLAKSFRDGLQKALWIKNDAPGREKLVAALEQMIQNPESVALLQEKVGNYDWVVGDAGNANRDKILSFTTEQALKAMLAFQTQALGFASVYKSNLISE